MMKFSIFQKNKENVIFISLNPDCLKNHKFSEREQLNFILNHWNFCFSTFA